MSFRETVSLLHFIDGYCKKKSVNGLSLILLMVEVLKLILFPSKMVFLLCSLLLFFHCKCTICSELLCKWHISWISVQ